MTDKCKNESSSVFSQLLFDSRQEAFTFLGHQTVSGVLVKVSADVTYKACNLKLPFEDEVVLLQYDSVRRVVLLYFQNVYTRRYILTGRKKVQRNSKKVFEYEFHEDRTEVILLVKFL